MLGVVIILLGRQIDKWTAVDLRSRDREVLARSITTLLRVVTSAWSVAVSGVRLETWLEQAVASTARSSGRVVEAVRCGGSAVMLIVAVKNIGAQGCAILVGRSWDVEVEPAND